MFLKNLFDFLFKKKEPMEDKYKHIRFKKGREEELKKQLLDKENTSETIRNLLVFLSSLTYTTLGKYIVITSLWRTEEEQKKLIDEGKSKTINSPHVMIPGQKRCRAVDIRANNNYWTEAQIELIKKVINHQYPRTDGFKTVF